MLEVVGGVGGVDGADGSAVGSKVQPGLVELEHGCVDAVADAESFVVAAADDAVADPEVALAGLERVRA